MRNLCSLALYLSFEWHKRHLRKMFKGSCRDFWKRLGITWAGSVFPTHPQSAQMNVSVSFAISLSRFLIPFLRMILGLSDFFGFTMPRVGIHATISYWGKQAWLQGRLTGDECPYLPRGLSGNRRMKQSLVQEWDRLPEPRNRMDQSWDDRVGIESKYSCIKREGVFLRAFAFCFARWSLSEVGKLI